MFVKVSRFRHLQLSQRLSFKHLWRFYCYQDRIKHVLTSYERVAMLALNCYANAIGKTGVVLVISNFGAINTVVGMAAAYMDSAPLVVISDNVAISAKV